MHHKRSFIAVLLSGIIVQILAHSVPWWSFVIILGLLFLVTDAALEAVFERHAA
jgi:predicted membrane protein